MKNYKNTYFDLGMRTKLTNFALINSQDVTRAYFLRNCNYCRLFFSEEAVSQEKGDGV